MTFKQTHSLITRRDEFERINRNYPDKIPIICETKQDDYHLGKLNKIKYLVMRDLTVGQFMYVIRKRLKIPPEKAIFLLVNNNVIPPTAHTIGSIYDKYKDPGDSMLYFSISSESFFG
jgi:GABA(A) receptor-associated protein